MQQLQTSRPLAISVDVEEYYHAANLSSVCPIRMWHHLPSRVEYSTYKLLDIFDECNQKGTFFVLGYCAKRSPELVREIVRRGHELASHGFAHKIAYLQGRKQFYRDVKRSKDLLEEISGVMVEGYRAPNFSIRDENLWAYEVLRELGYRYDSSLYPVHHDRYGNPHRSYEPEERETPHGILKIIPLSVFRLQLPRSEIRIPVAGGAYWRFLPKNVIAHLLRANSHKSNTPLVCYLHPWELDAEQPFFSSLPLEKKIRHYYGIRSFEGKLKYLLNRFSSLPIRDCIQDFPRFRA